MTSRDFVVVADAIRTVPDISEEQRAALAVHFSRKLAATQERFDAGRFVRAATGLDEEPPGGVEAVTPLAGRRTLREQAGGARRGAAAPPARCSVCLAAATPEGSSRVFSINHAAWCPTRKGDLDLDRTQD